ncbi:hypothetical protein BpHYR1_030051 [Brachionus plicatilis]|uniref:Uncharacterized protein n=1 Tax=Brachionus plicatilis TaxID=10195 RepID=A0A3M7QGX1_BRAPC|nr:hypothetical protein BpHYR1_030051 [Brachionus plicatilis]
MFAIMSSSTLRINFAFGQNSVIHFIAIIPFINKIFLYNITINVAFHLDQFLYFFFIYITHHKDNSYVTEHTSS